MITFPAFPTFPAAMARKGNGGATSMSTWPGCADDQATNASTNKPAPVASVFIFQLPATMVLAFIL
jgi:hypothetical protein